MKNIFLITVLFISLQSCGQNMSFTKGLVTERNYYSEIKFEYVSEKIIIPVTIQNKEYKFLLDTGAPNVISAEFAKKIKTKAIGSLKVSDASNKKNTLDMVSIPLIQFGGLNFKNTTALVDNTLKNLVFDCFDIDGIIGSNMLYKSILQIDLKRKLIILTDKEKRLKLDKSKATKLSLLKSQKSPYIWVNIEGNKKAREHLLIDTGMKGFYDLSKENFNLLQKNKVFNIHNTGEGSNGISIFGAAEKGKQYRIIVPKLKINNTEFNTIVTETTNDDNSRIGTKILNHGVLTIDFKNKRFYLDSEKNAIEINKKHFGFNLTIKNDNLAVGIVWDDSLKNDIEFGDEIIDVNGIDLDNIPVCKFLNSESIFKKDIPYDITFRKNDGTIKKLNVKKSYLK